MAFLAECHVWGIIMPLPRLIQFSVWCPCMTLPQLDEAEPRWTRPRRSKVVAPGYTPATDTERSTCSASLLTLGIVSPVHFSHLDKEDP